MQDERHQEVEYEKPVIEDYGDLAQLTAQQLLGTDFDQNFPILDLFHHNPS